MVDGINSNFAVGSNVNPPNIVDFQNKLIALGIPADIVQQGPQAVKSYADENGIALPAPPQRPQEAANKNSIFDADKATNGVKRTTDAEPPEGFKQQLIALGIPEATISQGRDAVILYAENNEITLPAPPSPPDGVDMDSIVTT